MTANIIIQAEGDDKTASVRYHCPMVALRSLFAVLSITEGYKFKEQDITELSEDMVVETLLHIGEVEFEIRKEEKLIESMILL